MTEENINKDLEELLNKAQGEVDEKNDNDCHETDKTSGSDNVTDSEEKTDTEKKENEKVEEKDPLEVANEEIAALKDKYLRSVAEFDNYRKRTLKEKSELILNGGEKTIVGILPILDDMERAIENGKKSEDAQAMLEGIELIFNKFLKTLEGMGVTKIDAADCDFDTDVHEAIAMVPGMGDDKKGKVLDCVQTGYKLNDKVIRHAKVAVGQ